MINRKADDVMEITQESYNELQKELEERVGSLRKEIAAEISRARELGDLSENHAYHVAMEKKELNDNRVSDIENMLRIAKVAKDTKQGTVVRLGKTVQVENIANGSTRTLTLVGSEETRSAEPGEGKISVDSPIGEAIHNAKLGEIVVAELPGKSIEFKIIKFVDKKAA